MSGPPKLRAMNVASDSEARPVLVPSGNKTGPLSSRKPVSKPLRKPEKSRNKKPCELSSLVTSPLPSPQPQSVNVPSTLRRHEQLLHSNLSMNASCSSDASTDSFHCRTPTGRLGRSNSLGLTRKRSVSKPRSVASDGVLEYPPDGLQSKKRCAWITPNTDVAYFLFDFVQLIIVNKVLCREVFADFDLVAVSKFNERRTIASGTPASSLLSEVKLRAIIENARQISKVIDEFGSFEKYIWSFVNHKPIVSKFRYPRQVPVKTPKADVISKDLVRRGFRGVGPTVIYSFMQAVGLTNDHLISCFRFQECIDAAEGKEVNAIKDDSQQKQCDTVMESDMSIAIHNLSFTSE
ncbi:hypothetical protein TanjilG_26185 [Lupinus angustifolius]|uniref:Uncharacterized protein n=1 Tax=Lupinus angustifolius TaxID=3871 RepID=A0A4P1R232_LUPAN|nr:hypothetical protein TanjilG_26185 [Lupinus angustifolius]